MYVKAERRLSERTVERVEKIAEGYGVSFDAALEALCVEALDQVENPELYRATCGVFAVMAAHIERSIKKAAIG